MARPPDVTLTAAQRDSLIAACFSAAPLEACGFIMDGEVVPVENMAKEPGRFAMSVTDTVEAFHAHRSVEAVWHSHPGGTPEPSEADWDAHPPLLWLIIVLPDRVTCWYRGSFVKEL